MGADGKPVCNFYLIMLICGRRLLMGCLCWFVAFVLVVGRFVEAAAAYTKFSQLCYCFELCLLSIR